MELIQGHDSYNLEHYKPGSVSEDLKAIAPDMATSEALPAPAGRYGLVYSNKHEKLLLRLEHIERLENIRNWYNRNPAYPGQPSLIVSAIVNACLDFIFDHSIPFHRLERAEDARALIAQSVYRAAITRWRCDAGGMST